MLPAFDRVVLVPRGFKSSAPLLELLVMHSVEELPELPEPDPEPAPVRVGMPLLDALGGFEVNGDLGVSLRRVLGVTGAEAADSERLETDGPANSAVISAASVLAGVAEAIEANGLVGRFFMGVPETPVEPIPRGLFPAFDLVVPAARMTSIDRFALALPAADGDT